MPQKIGKLLKTERQKADISQKEFAEKYGRSVQQIGNIERAEHLSTQIIEKYLDVLDTEMVILFQKKTTAV